VGATGIGLILGGAAGNLVDVIRHGATIDYLRVGARVVNLADVALTVGVLLLLVDLLV
jgi:signal peptidase II